MMIMMMMMMMMIKKSLLHLAVSRILKITKLEEGGRWTEGHRTSEKCEL